MSKFSINQYLQQVHYMEVFMLMVSVQQTAGDPQGWIEQKVFTFIKYLKFSRLVL